MPIKRSGPFGVKAPAPPSGSGTIPGITAKPKPKPTSNSILLRLIDLYLSDPKEFNAQKNRYTNASAAEILLYSGGTFTRNQVLHAFQQARHTTDRELVKRQAATGRHYLP